jgi:hypothetical protein
MLLDSLMVLFDALRATGLTASAPVSSLRMLTAHKPKMKIARSSLIGDMRDGGAAVAALAWTEEQGNVSIISSYLRVCSGEMTLREVNLVFCRQSEYTESVK